MSQIKKGENKIGEWSSGSEATDEVFKEVFPWLDSNNGSEKLIDPDAEKK